MCGVCVYARVLVRVFVCVRVRVSTCSTDGCLYAISRFFINDYVFSSIVRWSRCFMSFVGAYFFIPISCCF